MSQEECPTCNTPYEYWCPLCDFSTTLKAELEEHFKEVHQPQGEK